MFYLFFVVFITMALRKVRCPQCGGESVWDTTNKYRPFCSERCKLIDLGAWGNEEFRMPAQTPPEDAPFGDPKTES